MPKFLLACGGGEDYSYQQMNYLLSRYDINHKYFNFNFDPTTPYYGLSENVDAKRINLQDWSGIFGLPKNDSSLYRFVYENSSEALLEKKYQDPAIAKAAESRGLLPYFILTNKYVELMGGDSWNYDADSMKIVRAIKAKALYQEAEQLLTSNKNNKMSWRYFYLLLRIPFFNGDYQQTQKFFTKYRSTMPADDGLVSVWCNGILSGVENKIGDKGRAKLLSARAFMQSNDQYHAYYNSYKQINASYKDALAFSTNKSDSIAVYLCESFTRASYDKTLISELQKLDRNDDAYAIIWLREVQKVDRALHAYDVWVDDAKQLALNKSAAMQNAKTLMKIANDYLAIGGKHSNLIASTMAYYTNEINLKPARNAYLQKAKLTATDDFERNQYRILELVSDFKDGKKTINIENILQAVDAVKTQGINNFYNNNTQLFLVQHVLMPSLLQKKDSVNATLAGLLAYSLKNNLSNTTSEWYSYNNSDYDPADYYYPFEDPNTIYSGSEYDVLMELNSIPTLEKIRDQFLKDKAVSNSTRTISSYLPNAYTADYFNYFIAARYMRKEQWGKALSLYQGMQALKDYKSLHPYTFKIRDIIRYDNLPEKNMTSLEIIDRAKTLKDKIDLKTASAKDFFDYGSLLYNTSAYGANHFLMCNHFRYPERLYFDYANIKSFPTFGAQPYNGSYLIGNNKISEDVNNYFRLHNAKPYFEKALQGFASNEDKTKCLYYLAKIHKNNLKVTYQKLDYNLSDKEYQKRLANNQPSDKNNPYFVAIKNMKPNTVQQQIASECSNYRYFVGR